MPNQAAFDGGTECGGEGEGGAGEGLALFGDPSLFPTSQEFVLSFFERFSSSLSPLDREREKARKTLRANDNNEQEPSISADVQHFVGMIEKPLQPVFLMPVYAHAEETSILNESCEASLPSLLAKHIGSLLCGLDCLAARHCSNRPRQGWRRC